MDNQARLWVILSVADPNYRAGVGPIERSREGVSAPVIRDLARVYDAIVEVYDTRSQQLIASQRFDNQFFHALGGNQTVRFYEDDDQHLVEVNRLDLIP
jgi:hypothetical protein